MSYEEKACYCESQADLMGEGFCRDNYLRQAKYLREKGKLEKEATKKAEEKVQVELRDKDEQLKEKDRFEENFAEAKAGFEETKIWKEIKTTPKKLCFENFKMLWH